MAEKKLYILTLLVALIYPRDSFSESEVDSPCKKDSECILFENSCGETTSVLKSPIDPDHVDIEDSSLRDGVIRTTLKGDCLVLFIAQPRRPEFAVAKCVEAKCVVGSEKPEVKKMGKSK